MLWHTHVREVQMWHCFVLPMHDCGMWDRISKTVETPQWQKQVHQHISRVCKQGRYQVPCVIMRPYSWWMQMTSLCQHCLWILRAVHKHGFLKTRFEKVCHKPLTILGTINTVYLSLLSTEYWNTNIKTYYLFAFNTPSSYWNLHKLLWAAWIFFSLSSQVNYNKC